MPALKISVLGPLQISAGNRILKGFESNKARALLAYLAVEMDRPHSRERLVELLWPESPPDSALAKLRYALANVRKTIGDSKARPPYLLVSRESLQFNAMGNYELDVVDFKGALTTKDPDSLSKAVVLYRGDFLEGFPSIESDPFEEWLVTKREQFKQQGIEALRQLAEHHEQRGEYHAALPFARRQIELQPWLEEAHRQLMRALTLDGQRTAALAQYEICRKTLASELDVEPARETTRLYESIRDGRRVTPRPIPKPLKEEAPPPFVARQAELDQLDGFLDRALAGHGQMAFVTGSPGSGKTALVHEFVRRAMRTHNSLLVTAGNCNAYTGVGDPYLPFLEALQLLTGDTEAKRVDATLTNQTTRRLLVALPTILQALTELAPDLLDRFISPQALLERARALLPAGEQSLERLDQFIQARSAAPGRDEPQQVDLFEQYAHVLSSIARTHPLILVIDDLQWADDGSLGLLFHLGKRLGGQRILLVGAYRPEEIAIGRDGGRHPLEKIINEFKRDFGRIQVDLDQSEGRLFVQALLDSEPNCLDMKFRETLYRHTSGHPLFTVELLRGLQERGDLIANTAGQWTEGSTLDWESLPPRVEAVIAERIRRLPERLQALLSAASVEGEEFTAEIVARVCEAEQADIIQELSGTLSKQHRLVRAQGTGRMGGHRISRYRFAHFLFQKYLYQQLDAIERARAHEIAGVVLENLVEQDKEAYAVELARHFEIAGIHNKAIDYLWIAGQRAVRLLINEEAAAHYRHGLELLRSLPDSPEKMERELKLQTSIAVPLLAMRGWADPELEQTYARAREICQQMSNVPALFHALRGIKSYYDLRGDIRTALDLSRQLLSIAEQQGTDDLLVMAHSNMGVTLLYAGDPAGYAQQLDKVAELHVFDRHRLVAFTFGYDPTVGVLAHAIGLWMLGYPDQALERSRQAVELADKIGYPFSQAMAYHFAAMLHVLRGEPRAVLEWATKTIACSEQHRIRDWYAGGLNTKGWAIAHLGRAEEGVALFEQGNDILRAADQTMPLFMTGPWLAETYDEAGKAEEGLLGLEELIQQSMHAGFLQMMPQNYQCRGALLLKLGKAEEAEASLEKALEFARQQKAKGWELRVMLALARLWASQGRGDLASRRLREVYDWFTEGFDTPDLIDARSLLEELRQPAA